MGYEFCSQFTDNAGDSRGTIFTVLVLEDVGESYTVLHEDTLMEDLYNCQGVDDGDACCTTVNLTGLHQFVATGPHLAYALVTPSIQEANENYLLEFSNLTLAYQRAASVYTLGSSSVTKAALGIINTTSSSVRGKRFQFILQQPQPSTPVMVSIGIQLKV